MAKVTFVFQGKECSGDFDATTSLLSAAEQLGVPILSTCGGQPSCTDCRVKVLEGLEHLSKPEFDEINLMGSVSHITGVRLSCQSKPHGDVKVEALRLRGQYDREAREAKQRQRQDRYLKDQEERRANNPRVETPPRTQRPNGQEQRPQEPRNNRSHHDPRPPQRSRHRR